MVVVASCCVTLKLIETCTTIILVSLANKKEGFVWIFFFFFIYIYFFKDHFWTFPQGNIGSKNIVGSEDGGESEW